MKKAGHHRHGDTLPLFMFVRVLYRPPQKNPQTEWSGDRGGAFSTALEPEPFIPDTVADSTNRAVHGEFPRFWCSR